MIFMPRVTQRSKKTREESLLPCLHHPTRVAVKMTTSNTKKSTSRMTGRAYKLNQQWEQLNLSSPLIHSCLINTDVGLGYKCCQSATAFHNIYSSILSTHASDKSLLVWFGLSCIHHFTLILSLKSSFCHVNSFLS